MEDEQEDKIIKRVHVKNQATIDKIYGESSGIHSVENPKNFMSQSEEVMFRN